MYTQALCSSIIPHIIYAAKLLRRNNLARLCLCVFSQMIEVVASMARGPVFLAGEVLECLITFTNPMSHLSTSASR